MKQSMRETKEVRKGESVEVVYEGKETNKEQGKGKKRRTLGARGGVKVGK